MIPSRIGRVMVFGALALLVLLMVGLGLQRAQDAASGADAGTDVTGTAAMQPSGEQSMDVDTESLDWAAAVAPPRLPGPNFVTRVDGIPIWELPEDELEPHLATLRSLVDAGWSQAFVPMIPIAALCITMPPPTTRAVVDQQHPEYGSMYRHLSDGKESERDRRAMREQRMAFLEARLEQTRKRRSRCAAVLGDDPDPDRFMDWLELALEQQPSGFFRTMLSE